MNLKADPFYLVKVFLSTQPTPVEVPLIDLDRFKKAHKDIIKCIDYNTPEGLEKD